MENGDRMCFSVTIVDDNEIEWDEDFYFHCNANDSSRFAFYDYTQIIVTDNEG